jgi:hypothetical protein
MKTRPVLYQSGSALIFGLIILMLMTILTIATFKLGKSSTEIIGNMQQRSEVENAANSTIDQVISSTLFFQSPNSAINVPCGVANTACFDSNGDGTNDVTVTLTPAPKCIKTKTIKNADLSLTNPQDVGCAVGVSQVFGTAGATTGDSLCADSLWEVSATAVDSVTQAKADVKAGVGVRVATDDVATACL